MKENDCSFISALLFVGAGLFLILLLFSFRYRLFLRFTVRINNTFHRFTDGQLIQYTKTWSYRFHQCIQEIACAAVSSVEYSDIS